MNRRWLLIAFSLLAVLSVEAVAYPADVRFNLDTGTSPFCFRRTGYVYTSAIAACRTITSAEGVGYWTGGPCGPNMYALSWTFRYVNGFGSCRGMGVQPPYPNNPEAQGGFAGPGYVCLRGGVVAGTGCVCDAAWETDNGSACERTAGACPITGTTGCNKAAADLQARMPPTGDVRRVFHETLTCGIRTACTARCQMDNCKWLDQLSPASTGPYLRNEVPWPQIVANCNALMLPPPAKIAICAGAMAARNIRHDLTEALVKYGCGTDRDWDIIFEVNFSMRSTCMPARTSPTVRRSLSAAMKEWRDQTRDTCVARRIAAGKDPFINNELRGQSCGS